ncbi:hybrid sensor histidine kinase/response regulator [Rhodoferax lacus]|uniref:Virulence sensor protein BvgS n=2 Tax=Rhodoferax lacus TaxID=2184758 RepID=A0A3E1RF83_9BURK|nr:hybrid sensor histidine kinase/response regulator [Rhodoferax lacus]
MQARTNNQRYLLWLALGTAAMALAMASLLVFVLAQKRAIDQSSAIQSDSLTALAFQFEREFLRTRQSFAVALANPDAADLDELTLRYDIFQSRLTLLRESPGVSLLASRSEYQKVIPRLEHLVSESDQALSGKPMDRGALAHALAEFNSLGSDVQALTLAANSEVARLLERQSDTMRKQNALIVWLTVAQLVLLLIASGALVLRQRRLEAERLALEKMTDELREAHFRAEAANRGKSQFLANMSHELRTPFNGLMGMLGLMQSTPMTPQQADYIETAQGSASHLLTLLNDILDLSALETGKMTIKPAPLDLPRLLREVNALMLPLAKSKGLGFQIHAPSGPLAPVLADETRIKQIVFNLVSNAIKFTAQGRVDVRVSWQLLPDAIQEVAFEIQDTGLGMDASVLSRLFQRFYQVDDSSTRRFGGTGLGLEISQSLANMMDGEITVRSEVGVGSTFTATLRLPLDTAAPALPAVVPAGATQVSLPLVAAPVPELAHTLRVLVVEDHPINQKLVGVLLGRMGCHISYCENGQLAVEQVQREAFDLILMDVNMPVMDGLAATRLIRALPSPVADTPIVVLTADVMNEASEQALAAGANDFISKPLKVEQLRAIIQKHAVARTLHK